MLDIKNFTYDGTSLSGFNTTDADTGVTESFLICEFDNNSSDDSITFGNLIHNSQRPANAVSDIYTGYQFGDAIEFSFQILCVNGDIKRMQEAIVPKPMSANAIQKLTYWLIKPNYRRAIVTNRAGSSLAFNVTNTVQVIRYNGQIIGLQVTCKNDSCYAYKTVTYNLLALPSSSIRTGWGEILSEDANIGLYCSPTISFTCNSNVNNSTFELMINHISGTSSLVVEGLNSSNQTITIDCARKLINSHADGFNFIFPKIYKKSYGDGVNLAKITDTSFLSRATLTCEYKQIPNL